MNAIFGIIIAGVIWTLGIWSGNVGIALLAGIAGLVFLIRLFMKEASGG